MRALLPALTLALAVGCTSNEGVFQHQSTLYSTARGVALEDDVSAQAGMVGNTCQVSVGSAVIGTDQDVAVDDDHVEDAFGGSVLVRGTDGLHLYSPSDWSAEPRVIVPGGGLLGGALYDGGVLSVRESADGFTVGWSDARDADVAVDGAFAELAVDRRSGTAFVSTDGDVMRLDTDGAVLLDAGAHIAWDAVSEVVYVADADGNELRALDAEGEVRFSTSISGRILSVQSLGGRAVVSVEHAARDGELVVVDGFTGEVLSTQATPGGAPAMKASPSGDTLAIVLPNQVHFFRALR